MIVNGFCCDVMKHLPMEFAVEAQALASRWGAVVAALRPSPIGRGAQSAVDPRWRRGSQATQVRCSNKNLHARRRAMGANLKGHSR